MTRIVALLCPALLGGLLVALGSSAVGQENPKQADSTELIDTFLQSLNPKDDANEDSDRCPGETEADRVDSEPAPVVNAKDADESPESGSAGGEATDEPNTLPDGIDAAPIPGGKPEKTDKTAKTAKTSDKTSKSTTEKKRPERGERATISDEPQTPGDEPLTPELLELKEKVRDTLAWYYDRPQRVNDRSPWGIMHWLIPFGVDSYILDSEGKRQNTVGYLCYNYSCKGQRLFHLENGQIAAYIGPGLQGHRGQFLAMLAQSKVDPNYPMRIEGRAFKVADLIDYEKRTCEAGTELTFKLIALAHYAKHDDKWKNAKGEDWDVARLIREELKQPVVGSACGGTHRMTGFSYAVRKHEARLLPMDGQWLRAEKFIVAYHDYTYSLQNRDGSFSTNWFASKGDLQDPQRRLQTSGHILEWLVYSVPPEMLRDREVVRGVQYVTTLLHQGKNNQWEIGPLGHALHALALYDERVFGGKPGKRAEQLADRPAKTRR